MKECYQPYNKSVWSNKSVPLMNIEKLKSQKDIFVDMRSDGEITKVDVNVNGRKNNPVV